METVVLVIALWLILVGIYGALSLLSGAGSGARQRRQRPARAAQQRLAAADEPYGAAYEAAQGASGALLSEVDLLRAQVRHLRSEIFAMADKPEAGAGGGNRPKRYRGQSELPRPLRRHLRETRGVRTA